MLNNSIALFSLSGTGNTRMLSAMLTRYFAEYGVTVHEYRIEDYLQKDIPDLSKYDIIGIGYPIHAFNAPMPVIKFAEKLPTCNGQQVFFFKTSGEPFPPNHSSSYILHKKMVKKSYKLIFERHFLMPYNIMFKYPDSLVKQMISTNELLAKGMAKSILQDKHELLDYKIASRINSFNFRYIMHYGAKVNGKLFRANKKCNLCQICVSECPSRNITCKNGKIKFGWDCFLCMSCVLKCSKNAISIGLLNLWALNGRYDFDRIMLGENIKSSYVNIKTAGYFRLFKKYYLKASEIIDRELG